MRKKWNVKIFLVIAAILLVLGFIFHLRKEPYKNVELISMELNCKKEDITVYNLLDNKNYSLTLVKYIDNGKKVWLLHWSKAFRNDRLIYLSPTYRVKEVSRRQVFSQRMNDRNSFSLYKVVE